MPFRVTDLVFRIQINDHRDEAQIEMVGCGGDTVRAAIVACGRTNQPLNTVDPNFEFAGRMISREQFDRLRQAVRELSQRLDSIDQDMEDDEGGEGSR